MQSLGIDLAERHSAACVLAGDYSVLGEFPLDLGDKVKEVPWDMKIKALHLWWESVREVMNPTLRTAVYIESLPPRAFTVRPAQTQGILMAMLWRAGYEQFEFVTPHQWQSHFGYSRKVARQKVSGRGTKTTKGWAKEVCEQFGYNPDSVGTQGGKVKIDVRDAYLIARYGLDKALDGEEVASGRLR